MLILIGLRSYLFTCFLFVNLFVCLINGIEAHEVDKVPPPTSVCAQQVNELEDEARQQVVENASFYSELAQVQSSTGFSFAFALLHSLYL